MYFTDAQLLHLLNVTDISVLLQTSEISISKPIALCNLLITIFCKQFTDFAHLYQININFRLINWCSFKIRLLVLLKLNVIWSLPLNKSEQIRTYLNSLIFVIFWNCLVRCYWFGTYIAYTRTDSNKQYP
jgi:hypothetical protein